MAMVGVSGFHRPNWKRHRNHEEDSDVIKPVDKRNGADFFVVGDFGWVRDMTDPNSVFDAIDSVKGQARPGSFDDGEFFISVGDNLYPHDDFNPTDEEWDTVMSLF